MVNADTLRKLASLNLSAEQMQVVLEILADSLEKEDVRKEKQRDRVRKCREKRNGNSYGNVTVTPTPSLETKNPPHPHKNPIPSPKENPPKGGQKKGGEITNSEPLGEKPEPDKTTTPAKPPLPKPKPNRGCRLDAFEAAGKDELPDEFLNFSVGELGWSDRQAWWVWDQFWTYWTSGDAGRPLKKNWLATWQNWCRKEGPPAEWKMAKQEQNHGKAHYH